MLSACSLTRRLLPALAFCALLFAALLTGSAGAELYGGLGRTGASTIKAGVSGAHGQVDPFTEHNFVVNSSTGAFYIADEIEEGGKNRARVQAFGAKGEFVAENRVTIGPGTSIGGLAVDPVKHKLYLLIKLTRDEVNQKIQKEAEKKETEGEKLEKEGKTAEAEKSFEEASKLQEQAEKVHDPGLTAASEIRSFSTEASAEKLGEEKVLAGKGTLEPTSEENKQSLIAPAGIAVDPKTHDVIVVGQQDEATERGAGSEQLRAAVQRIHEKGELGPRYIDSGDCLDQGEPSIAEPACSESRPEQPHSPIVTPQGSVYVEVGGEAIWEVPTATESSGPFKEVSSQPKRVFTLGQGQKLLVFGGAEEVANTMAFAETAPGQGRIYLAAGVETTPALLVLNWVEKSPTEAEVTERGWTGGQEKSSSQEKCVIPPPSLSPLVGAIGETGLVFDSKREIGSEAAVEAVFGFGSAAGAEACGHVEVTAPHVELGAAKEVKTVPVGSTPTVTSQVVGANAKHTVWKLHPISGGAGDEEESTGAQFQTTALKHTFAHAGEYEITEEVETDNLGAAVVVKKLIGTLLVSGSKPKVAIVPPSSARVGEPAKFEATVTDEGEPTPHLKYTWIFGDGSTPVTKETTGATLPVEEHSYLRSCVGGCQVTLEVTDGKGATGIGKTEVTVLISKAEEEKLAKEKAEREHSSGGGGGGGGTTTTNTSTNTGGGGGGGVAGHVEAHDPEAKIAGTSLGVSNNGSFTIKISCPTGETTCIGTVTLKTLKAVSAKAKKSILTLALGSFSVAGGQVKTITLHLSSKARKLLAKQHTLHASATVVAHDPANVSHTTKSTVLLRLLKAKH